MIQLNDEQLRRDAPSVFAESPWHERSDEYRFIPTIQVVNGLRDSGFVPMTANQSSSRIPGKKEFTKHVLRFRRVGDYQVGDVIPEVVLVNSHDGASTFQLSLGLYRLICRNGLMVGNTTLEAIRVTHRGSRDLCRDVIDASARILDDAPQILEAVNRFQGITLSQPEQIAFAGSALQLYDSALDIRPESLIAAKRLEDHGDAAGSRDLWRTYNVVQENMIRGGVAGRTAAGGRLRTRKITSVDRDLRLNKALWDLTAKMAELKQEQPAALVAASN